MSQDRAQGTMNRGKGAVKEEVGKLVGDRSTEWSGKADQVKGKVQETVADAKETVDEATDTRRFADGRVR
jgi:uncharacterized protein YjbJ (UPF0337 family)